MTLFSRTLLSIKLSFKGCQGLSVVFKGFLEIKVLGNKVINSYGINNR